MNVYRNKIKSLKKKKRYCQNNKTKNTFSCFE